MVLFNLCATLSTKLRNVPKSSASPNDDTWASKIPARDHWYTFQGTTEYPKCQWKAVIPMMPRLRQISQFTTWLYKSVTMWQLLLATGRSDCCCQNGKKGWAAENMFSPVKRWKSRTFLDLQGGPQTSPNNLWQNTHLFIMCLGNPKEVSELGNGSEYVWEHCNPARLVWDSCNTICCSTCQLGEEGKTACWGNGSQIPWRSTAKSTNWMVTECLTSRGRPESREEFIMACLRPQRS